MAKPTTSVGQTFASFSLQVKWLMIASELQENEMKLKRTAEVIRVLSSHIVEMVQRVIACIKDEDAGVQVAKGCDRVHAAADSLVVASQMVDISGSGFRRSGSLVGQATLLHEATVELLKIASDVEATSVARCSQSIYPALNSLLSATDLNHLEDLVMSYSEVVSRFENDVSKRNVLICEAVNFQAVNSSIDALKKSIPLLNASLKTLLMYPEIEDAQVSKNNVVGLVLSSLDSLSEALRKKNQNWPLIDSSLEIKQFSTVCNGLVENLQMIAATNSMSSQDLTDLDVQLNHIVQFAMDLAAVAGKESKTNIFKTCSMLLENLNKISQQSQSSSHSALHDGTCSVSVSAEWHHFLIDCLSQLQAKVVDTLPHVIFSIIIKDHTKPVFDLLKALKERNHSEDFLLESKEPVKSCGGKVQICAVQFRAQLKDICTSMRLAVAGSTSDPRDVQEMHRCICTAEELGNKILVETEALPHDDLGRSKSDIESLETDCNEWCISAKKLLESTHKLVSAEVLLMLCGEMIWKRVSLHSHLSMSKDESVMLMTHRFLLLSAKINDKHLDAWLKNGLRRKIAALERVLNELKSSDGLERRCNTRSDSMSDSTCFYRLLQQSVSDICWCVKTGRLTNDLHEESLSVVRTAFDHLIDNALTDSNSTELKESEVSFDLLTSLSLHGSAICEIKEIIDCLIFGAVSGADEEEMRSRRLLYTSNHILHSVLLVMGTVEQKDRKRSFIFDKLAQLTDLVPMILDEASNIRSFQTYDLEPLYKLGEKLCHTMSLLIDFVDEILVRWNPLLQNLITSAMAGNWLLLKKEIEELNYQILALLDLTSLAKDKTLEFEDEDFRTLTKTDSLKEFIEEIESFSYRVMSATRKMNSNVCYAGKSDFVPELRVLLRDWSTRVFFLNSRLDRLSVHYLDSGHTWKKHLLWMRQENDRLKNEMSSDGENETVQMLEDLNRICDQLDDLAKLSNHLFLSQKLAVLSSQWSSKARRLQNYKKDRTSSIGSGQQSSSTVQSYISLGNGKMEKMPLDVEKRSRNGDGPAVAEAIPQITGDENTIRQIKQEDWFEKYISDRSATDISSTSDKILRDVQSPINVSSKTVKKQVFPVQRTTRFLGYKNDDGAYATSGSIVDCIHEMSKAAYQLKAHLQAQRESFGNLTVNKDGVTELLVTIQKKEEKVVQVANVLVNYCLDERIGDDVRFALQHVQSILSQLYILVGVKMAIDDTYTEDKNLKTSIQRLLDSLKNLKCGFEAVCVKGLKQSPSESINDREIRAMARWWKTNWIQSQSLNSLHADKDEIGLRTSKNYLPPQPL